MTHLKYSIWSLLYSAPSSAYARPFAAALHSLLCLDTQCFC